ncbi:MAG: hypothetical protein A2Z81_03690 [Omnitrophica WOR_2 bacterium GWA2_45_18]|nr:MAG: hypothetical protein A2Z81_03690 [Omnitrophica WOR_2 bacterium GWA2_45_18]
MLGCGWLGLPLGRRLVELGYPVKGSTTRPEKMALLKEAGIEPFLITVDARDPQPPPPEAFLQSNILFLNIPFKRGFGTSPQPVESVSSRMSVIDPQTYKQQMDAVVSWIETSSIEFVIFASSTSIYPDRLGEVTEDTVFTPDHPRAEVLLRVEEALCKNKYFETTIIRFAGMYGGDRRIGKFLSGKKALGSADRPVNLIHRDDCVGIVTQIIQRNVRGEIFNACSDGHPARGALYAKAALALGLPPPRFSDGADQPGGKIVSNTKLKERLGYQFHHPDPLND